MDEQRLRKNYVLYVFAAVLFTVTLSVAVVVQRYCTEMRDTVDKLKTLSGSSVRVKRATLSAQEALVRIKREVPGNYLSSSVENTVYQTVDAIREQARNAEVVVESLQDRDNEVLLPITIKGTLDDYAGFLKLLHLLESLRFPFFSTSELVMTHEADKPANYELRGSVRTFKPSEAGDGDQRSRPRRRG
jgi:hypothetical protein